jgi:uncharacterized protein
MSTNRKILFSLLSAIALIIIALVVRAIWINYREARELDTVRVGDATFEVDVADSPFRRMKGLSGLTTLPENEGLLMIFKEKDTPTIWPKNLKFPIDIIWIDDSTVVGVEKNAMAESNLVLDGIKLYIPNQPINKVLQINAGLADKLNIGPGRWVDANIGE